jgi:outer membrane protein assembly factor BamB
MLAGLKARKRTMRIWIAIAAASVVTASAADWPGKLGDPQQSGWQRYEDRVTPESIRGFRLLWKVRVGNPGSPAGVLDTPIILGHIISHRGMKELVFAAGSDGTVYSVDADLGTLFWERRLEDSSSHPENAACEGVPAPSPVLTPAPGRIRPPLDDDDEGPDPTHGNRPLRALSAGGRIYEIHPSTGNDTFPPQDFLPAQAGPARLTLSGRFLYAAAPSCGSSPGRVWSIDTRTVPPTIASYEQGKRSGIAAGFDGVLYALGPDSVVALTPGSLQKKDYYQPAEGKLGSGTPVVFAWEHREWVGVFTEDSRILVLDSRSLGGASHHAPAFRSEPLPGAPAIESLTTARDARGVRWIYATTGGTEGKITAFRVEEKDGNPVLQLAWESPPLVRPSTPAVGGGIIYTLVSSGSSAPHTILYGFDAETGKELYSSGGAIQSAAHSNGMALANGHVCFGASDNTLYCFGIPYEM